MKIVVMWQWLVTSTLAPSLHSQPTLVLSHESCGRCHPHPMAQCCQQLASLSLHSCPPVMGQVLPKTLTHYPLATPHQPGSSPTLDAAAAPSPFQPVMGLLLYITSAHHLVSAYVLDHSLLYVQHTHSITNHTYSPCIALLTIRTAFAQHG